MSDPAAALESQKGEELARLLRLKRNRRGWYATIAGERSSVGLFRIVRDFMKEAVREIDGEETKT